MRLPNAFLGLSKKLTINERVGVADHVIIDDIITLQKPTGLRFGPCTNMSTQFTTTVNCTLLRKK